MPALPAFEQFLGPGILEALDHTLII
jgi:hypothetical protein